MHVTYDPKIIDYSKLLAGAQRMRCTSAVYTYDDDQLKIAKQAGTSNIIPWKPSQQTRSVRKSEQKYHLRNTTLAYLPLNELQAVKLNVLSSRRGGQLSEVRKILSPRQIAMMGQIPKRFPKTQACCQASVFPKTKANYRPTTICCWSDLKK